MTREEAELLTLSIFRKTISHGGASCSRANYNVVIFLGYIGSSSLQLSVIPRWECLNNGQKAKSERDCLHHVGGLRSCTPASKWSDSDIFIK
jgi:hypothetical protein